MRHRWVLLATVLVAGLDAAQGGGAERPDIVLADFEGTTYGDWKATGTAFGSGPARGTLPHQMHVSGFEGKGLVNSFLKGDRSTGTLTSPPFAIVRTRLNFLLGGGMHPGRTCIDLLVDGKTVRTATGPNDRPGGSERLDWYSWDVAALAGKTAQIRIVDRHRGGWGHINIDHITQSDRPRGITETIRDIRIEHPYLAFQMPPRQGKRTHVTLITDGATIHTARGGDNPKPYWMSWDVSELKGTSAQLCIAEQPSPDGARPLHHSVAQCDQPKGILMVTDKLYEETHRPQFHFTPARNWTNDPNGLVFYKGEYHLFFQHNPHGINWGNMTWGHAVSPDMVHWTQIDHALHPDKLGTIFSGSAVVDPHNTAGFQTGDETVLVCIYTSAGGTSPESKGQPFTQSIAYSNDRGRSWTKYARNPVLRHVAGRNRDPKVIWHEPTKKWVMALYLDKNLFALFGSPNLKEWTRLCNVPVEGAAECPDFFELPVDGNAKDSRWVFWGANGLYLLGTFDGKTFKPQDGPHRSNWGGNCYAAQTWDNAPDARRLQIAWMNGGKYPEMPFNQQMCFPRELTLRTTPKGIRLFINPIREVESLHGDRHSWANTALKPGANLLDGIAGELFHIRADIALGKAKAVGFTLRGEKVHYDVTTRKLTCLGKTARLEPIDGAIHLDILLDRTTIEVFANHGIVSMPTCFLPDLANTALGIYAEGGAATATALDVWKLKPAWSDHAKQAQQGKK